MSKIKVTSGLKSIEYFNKYEESLRNGEISTIHVGIDKINEVFEHKTGLEWHSLWTISALSGHGKTTLVTQIENGILENNPKVYVFNFLLESIVRKIISKKIQSRLGITTQQLYDYNDAEMQNKIKAEKEAIKNEKIFYLEEDDTEITVDVMKTSIETMIEHHSKNEDYGGCVIIIDHSLLVEETQADGNERGMLKNLAKMLVKIKKKYKCSIILLNQMNDNILSNDRIKDPKGAGHYPLMNDVFGGRAIYHASDYLSVLHRPERLNITQYGPSRLDCKNRTYLHFIKTRDSKECIRILFNDLQHSRFLETEPILN